jgi:hypothetical protein
MTKRTYTAGDAAIAAGINVNTLRSWIQRSIVRLDTDEFGEVNGTGHKLRRRTVYTIATTAALVEAGFTPARASLIAERGVKGLSSPQAGGDVVIEVKFAKICERVDRVLDNMDANYFDGDGAPATGEIVE